jgi:hypothetical protein
MFAAVGTVIEFALNTPFINPITMKPFMLVIEAVSTTLFKPDNGTPIVI